MENRHDGHTYTVYVTMIHVCMILNFHTKKAKRE